MGGTLHLDSALLLGRIFYNFMSTGAFVFLSVAAELGHFKFQ